MLYTPVFAGGGSRCRRPPVPPGARSRTRPEMAMDSRIGLDYIVENPEYIAKLAAALDTPNVTVKKQVLELLSALCVYNAEGYARALDALERYQELKGERYRLKVIVSELQNATAIDYQTALVAFINCLLISTPQLKDRIRIRNEFIGLKLLPVLNDLRRSAGTVPDLGVQLDVFDEQRESDEAQALQGPHGVDLNSHLDVFYAILRQVADTPQEIPFLSILQHLLRVEPREPISDLVWDAAERLVHRATLLESRSDATRLLRSPSVSAASNKAQAGCHCACHSSRKQSAASPPPPPPPPPAAAAPACPPPPPPPPGPPPPPPPPAVGVAPPMGGAPVPPPLLAPASAPPPCSPEPTDCAGKLLPQQETPTPRAKMKTINWNKIPNHKVVGKRNIWSLVAETHEHSPMEELDWAEMEGLFCQQVPAASSTQASPRLGRDAADTDPRRRKESAEIALLDGKRSLNVNIFLKQFRSSNEDIIQLIRDGAHDEIGAEKLRGLLKILPEVDELEMLKSYDGDKSKLGNAEKFLLQLIDVPNYKLRIESMLLREEFASNMTYLEPSIGAMIVAGEDLMNSEPLHEVLYMVLVAGNFLNSGGYAGNAAGVKLSSLQKLTDIRANKPGMNLIHFVAMQAEKKKKSLLKFPEEMQALEEATKTTVEQLQNEINALDGRMKKIRKQIDLPTTEMEIKSQMSDFLKMAELDMSQLQKDMNELEKVRKALADFFCEDVATFKLEECYRIFHQFCVKFKQAVQENERRRVQEEQANMRRRQREEQLAAKRRHMSGQFGQNGSESESNLMDSLLYDIRSGFTQSKTLDRDMKGRKMQNGTVTSEEDISITSSPLVTRRRMGSFSGPAGEQPPGIGKDESFSYSPDITPNGSLRRRRSRVPSEEDDSNLMDFLRASGHDGSRERKSWGSLDRSWARRARGGGRKRPELLSADFSGENRERPSSPSPLVESKPLVPNTEAETKPKSWRQNVEAWLQDTEKDVKQSEDLRRRSRRIQSNRRSLEADSESEGRGSTLDTLPEEKATLGKTTNYKRVYPDWRPTIEKTDVVGAMEAIEDAQPHSTIKDKSAWRKSNLNVPNSAEETEVDVRRLRRMRSRGSIEPVSQGNPLQAIKEEDKRKGIIGNLGQEAAQDKLTLYIRRPSDVNDPSEEITSPTPEVTLRHPRRNTTEPTEALPGSQPNSPLMTRSQLIQKYRHSMDVPGDFLKTIVSEKPDTKTDDEQILPPTVPRRLRKTREDACVADKVEIDSDNIETPPAIRRNYASRTVHSEPSDSVDTTARQSPVSPTSDDHQFHRLSRHLTTNSDTPCRRIAVEDRDTLNKRIEKYRGDRVTENAATKETHLTGNRKAECADEEEILGDGQFDRFSLTRRTRRYKKNQDTSDKEAGSTNGEDTNTARRLDGAAQEIVPEKQIIKPNTLRVQSYSLKSSIPTQDDKESRLKKWQENLKQRATRDEGKVAEEALADITTVSDELQNLDRLQPEKQNFHYKTTTDNHGIKSRTEEGSSRSSEISVNGASTETRLRPRTGLSANRERIRSMIEPRQVEEALKLTRGSSEFSDKRELDPRRSFVSKSRKDIEKYASVGEREPKVEALSFSEKGTTDGEMLAASPQNSRQKSDFIPEIRINASGPGHLKSGINRTEHEMNDEGFEETQSLISETPSHGTSSGCNYDPDITDSPRSLSGGCQSSRIRTRPAHVIRADSSGSADTSSSTNAAQTQVSDLPADHSASHHELSYSKVPGRFNSSKTDTDTGAVKSRGTRHSDLSRHPVGRSSSLRSKHSNVKNSDQEGRRSIIPLRSNNLIKSDSQSSVAKPLQKRRTVERSNSRTSLRSSRSSLNSSTSVNTVKNAPQLSKSSSRSSVSGGTTKSSGDLSGYTTAIKALTTKLGKESGEMNSTSKYTPSKFGYHGSASRTTPKKPLTQVQLKSASGQHKSVPASRSSSSGSSIGPTIRRPRVTSGVSTSFKENVGTPRPASSSSVPASRSSSSGSSVGPPTGRLRATAGVSHRGSNFMRPTAASAAKDSVANASDISTAKLRSSSKLLK
ncbi:uncharacterized protein LOC124721206 [Schistocerca piceifrons]|uniref:uncharacterized protein LOC124721206 n=1 Tax=Schistocerca piceifrons TaxID=274613 RepID=UPI001F5FBFAA|nr:uncharacterized protein LOC124721206 [Schistocerca piceifrons]